MDDRRVVPRLGIRNEGKSSITYIRVVDSKTGKSVGHKSQHDIRINSLLPEKKTR
jgi:hypothetical protein